jgi:hypothetical protein
MTAGGHIVGGDLTIGPSKEQLLALFKQSQRELLVPRVFQNAG